LTTSSIGVSSPFFTASSAWVPLPFSSADSA
jgi:hypothetical protein